MEILIAGDYCPQQHVAEFFEHNDFSYVLGELKPSIEKVDYSIVNFECAVSKGGEKPIEKIGPCLQCSEKGVEALKWAGFDCVTLANNHFYDFGEEGVENTIKSCEKFGLDFVGGGKNLRESSSVLYKVIAGKTLAIINCCEHEFSIASETSGGANPLNPIQQFYQIKDAKNNADFVLVIVHGGNEMYQLPSPRMQETYRFFIDAGADAVVNHHQHCFSGYEYYKNKPIFYGLGNFCFEDKGFKDSIWNEGYMVLLSFSDTISFSFVFYRQCNENSKVCFVGKSENYLSKIEVLNNIIADPHRLKDMFVRECVDKTVLYRRMLEPYPQNHFLAILNLWGILPSLISKRRLLVFDNYLNCESHLDRFKQIIVNIKKHY